MTKEQISDFLYISEKDDKEAIRVKLLLAAILDQGIDIAGNILNDYKELADIMEV